MSDHKVDLLLRDLRHELDVDPSPAFAAGVRARMADDSSRRATWWWGAAALVAAGVLVVAGVTLVDERDAVVPGPDVVAEAPPARTGEAAAAGPAPGRPTPVRVQPRETARAPEVLVPPDQRILLEQLMTALREGRMHVEPGGPVIDETTGELVAPPAIEITPIVVRALPGTPERIGEGSTQK